MARIIDVLLNSQSEKPVELSRRQILFEENDLPTMVLEFEDLSTCQACETKENSNDENLNVNTPRTSSVVEASNVDLSESLCQLVPCISCRLSLERLYKQMVPKTADKISLALDPIQIDHQGRLMISSTLLTNMTASTDKFDKELEAIAGKSKKNKRCALHSTEGQNKSKKNLEDWVTTWNVLSSHNCTGKLLALDSEKVLESLNVYLRKNKFCSDCKLKVLIAYKILTNECQVDDVTYNPSLYEGLKCCAGSEDLLNSNPTHIHIRNDIGYIEQLICKAELEILGGRPERHATTISSAQEEVLICIGAYLYERIIKIGQSLKVQEQNWNMLFHVSLSRLVKNVQIAEIKNKEFNVDLICAELDAFDKQKRDQSRKKESVKKKSKPAPKKTKQPSVEKSMEEPEPSSVLEAKRVKENEETIVEQGSSSSSSKSQEPLVHTCLSSTKSAKLKMSKAGKQCRILSATRARERGGKPPAKARKNIELNLSDESCKCDDETAFSHELSQASGSSADSKCKNSCCFDIVEYWNKLTTNFGDDEGSDLDERFRITEEEKNEYFANKAFYLTIRTQRREMLKERFEEFKLKSARNLE